MPLIGHCIQMLNRNVCDWLYCSTLRKKKNIYWNDLCIKRFGQLDLHHIKTFDQELGALVKPTLTRRCMCNAHTYTHISLMCVCVCGMSEYVGTRGGELLHTSFPISDATLHRMSLPTNYTSDTLRKFPNSLPSWRKAW